MGCLTRPDYVIGRTIAGLSGVHGIRKAVVAKLFNEVEFRRWASYIAQYMPRAWSLCPDCYQSMVMDVIRRNTATFECQYCQKVWTPKRFCRCLENVAETPEQICTHYSAALVPFQGRNAAQQLYFYSVLALFAAIFFTFPRFTRYFLRKSLHYHWKELRRRGEDGVLHSPYRH
ncbi:hypothetical protein KCP70_12810 [Salmonella enterica subsp. enterica]|nr:hypothetical protein KCP70_12810 [Salmonella enterica subsp. enterica]